MGKQEEGEDTRKGKMFFCLGRNPSSQHTLTNGACSGLLGLALSLVLLSWLVMRGPNWEHGSGTIWPLGVSDGRGRGDSWPGQ